MEVKRCASCGLLGRRHTATMQLLETESCFRRTGRPGLVSVEEHHFIGPLLCAARKQEFHSLYLDNAETDGLDCGEFMEWQRGFTPKEHEQMRLSRELLADEQAWRDSRAKQDREWRQEDVRSLQKELRLNVWAVIVTAFIGVAGTLLVAWVGTKLVSPRQSIPPAVASPASTTVPTPRLPTKSP